jgi:hypothetical protein
LHFFVAYGWIDSLFLTLPPSRVCRGPVAVPSRFSVRTVKGRSRLPFLQPSTVNYVDTLSALYIRNLVFISSFRPSCQLFAHLLYAPGHMPHLSPSPGLALSSGLGILSRFRASAAARAKTPSLSRGESPSSPFMGARPQADYDADRHQRRAHLAPDAQQRQPCGPGKFG